MPTVLLLGTLDTKGAEYGYVAERLRAAGCRTLIVDAGVLGPPLLAPDLPRDDVAAGAGRSVVELAAARDRGAAIAAMAEGAAFIAKRLHAEGRVDGILVLGGSAAAAIGAAAMHRLPLGFPKLIVSTVASGDMRPYVGDTDIVFTYPVVDLSGLNAISEPVLANAAGAIAGMVQAPAPSAHSDRPLVGATTFGVTTPCVIAVRHGLEACGCDTVAFSANGVGGPAMERMLDAGRLSGVVDVTTTELADELVGGTLAAGPERLDPATRIAPRVVVPGALDMVNFGPPGTVPERHRARVLHRHNPAVTLMRTTPEECAELGERLARRVNAGVGPRAVVLPLRAVSALSVVGGPFHDPRADAALFEAVRDTLSAEVDLLEIDLEINEPEFAAALVERYAELHRDAAVAAGAPQ